MALTSTERSRRSRERRRARLSAPSLVAKAADQTIPDAALSPFELAVRNQRARHLEDLGGADALPLAKIMQVESLVARWIIRETLERDVMDLAQAGRLMNRRALRAYPVLQDWLRVADSYDRLLVAVGLEPLDHTDPADTLEGIVADIVANRKPQEALGIAQAATVLDGSSEGPNASARPSSLDGHAAPGEPEPVTVRPASLVPKVITETEVPEF